MHSACLAASNQSVTTVIFSRNSDLQPALTISLGQSNLPASCPICEHSPLSAEDCNPNKSLRTTIKVFLRTAEKKREAAKAKEAKERDPEPKSQTPIEPTPAPESAPDLKTAEGAAPTETASADEPAHESNVDTQPTEETTHEQAPHTEQVCPTGATKMFHTNSFRPRLNLPKSNRRTLRRSLKPTNIPVLFWPRRKARIRRTNRRPIILRG